MERMVQTQLEEARRLLLSMGGMVEKALESAVIGLAQRNAEKLAEVHRFERTINEGHIEVDEACLQFIVKQGPKGKDLRTIFAILKINTDLERMGDQCVNISYTASDYLTRGALYQVNLIETMASLVRTMVRESLDAFVREDVLLAERVLETDDQVDELKRKVFDVFLNEMKKNPLAVEACLDLILIARNLERLGDHATNIAEDVIFVSTGKDIRHGGHDHS